MYILRVVARKSLHLLSGAVLVARLSGREYSRRDSVMAHPPYGSAQKERIRFALCLRKSCGLATTLVIIAPLSFSRFKNGCAARVSSGTEKGGKRKRPAAVAVIPLS